MFYNLIAIFLGGGLGAILRYLITYLLKESLKMPIIGTFIVNLIGCFLIGFIFGLSTDKIQILSPTFKLMITVGFLGGLTTFSTFSFESFEFIKEGKILNALLYILASCTLGLAFVFIGYFISRNLIK